MQQLMNITMTAQSIKGMHDYNEISLGHTNCGVKLTLDSSMENTLDNLLLSSSRSVSPNVEMGL